MSKYIDAEKLIAEIEVLKRRKGFLQFENVEITEAYMARGVQFTCDDIVHIIQSFQQEHPEVDFEDKFAKFLERKDSELGANSWSEEDLRELALYFYYSRYDEQPEVDLEKEIDIQKTDFMELYNRVKKLLDDFGNLDADIAKDITELREYIKSLDM